MRQRFPWIFISASRSLLTPPPGASSFIELEGLVAQSRLTLTVACQPLLSMGGFPRQEYWSGLPFPSPVDLPNPGIKPGSSALQEDSLSSKPQGSPWNRLESPKTIPCIYDQVIFNKSAKTIWYFQEIILRKLDIHM